MTAPGSPGVGVQLDNLERLGKIVNAVGVPLLMVFFLAVSMGWIDSPVGKEMRNNSAMNQQIMEQQQAHHRKLLEIEATRSREFVDALAIIKRLTELLKMIDCSAISDKGLRERCLSR